MNTYFFQEYEVKELSYFEYKNLVKNILSGDENTLTKVIEKLVTEHVKSDRPLNIVDKIKCVIYIRCLVLGEEISVNLDNKNYNFNLNEIFNNIEYVESPFEYKNLTFTIPKKINYNSMLDCLIDNFQSFKLNEEVKRVDIYSYQEKKILLDNLIGWKINDFLRNYDEYIKKFNFYYIKNSKVNLFSKDVIVFIKNLFDIELSQLYDFEYNFMNHLNFNPHVFHMYGFPELRMFLNRFLKEQEENKKESGKKNLQI